MSTVIAVPSGMQVGFRHLPPAQPPDAAGLDPPLLPPAPLELVVPLPEPPLLPELLPLVEPFPPLVDPVPPPDEAPLLLPVPLLPPLLVEPLPDPEPPPPGPFDAVPGSKRHCPAADGLLPRPDRPGALLD